MTIFVRITTAQPGHPIRQAAGRADQLADTVRSMFVGTPATDYLADLDRLQTAVANGTDPEVRDVVDLQCRLDVWVTAYDHPVTPATVVSGFGDQRHGGADRS